MGSDCTDGQLIQRCKHGDQDAFERLYQRYRLPLYSYLNRHLPGQSHLVDDLYQAVWIKVLDNLDNYEHRQRFISWLLRIAHNQVVDHVRRQSRVETVELDERLPADNDEPWQSMDRDTLRNALQTAVGELADDQREVVLLRQQGMSFKDIAGIQGVSINTVLGRMHYAVKNLRRALSDWRS